MSDLVAVEMNRLRGRLCGLIESWGLDHGREHAMKQILKTLTYDSEKAVKELLEGFTEEHRSADDGAGSSPPSPSDRPPTRYVRMVGPWKKL